MAEKNDEKNTHGGPKDTETVTQKAATQQTSPIRKEISRSRPAVTTTEHIVNLLFPSL